MGSAGWAHEEGITCSVLSCPFAGGSIPQPKACPVLANSMSFTLSSAGEQRVTAVALSGGQRLLAEGWSIWEHHLLWLLNPAQLVCQSPGCAWCKQHQGAVVFWNKRALSQALETKVLLSQWLIDERDTEHRTKQCCYWAGFFHRFWGGVFLNTGFLGGFDQWGGCFWETDNVIEINENTV